MSDKKSRFLVRFHNACFWAYGVHQHIKGDMWTQGCTKQTRFTCQNPKKQCVGPQSDQMVIHISNGPKITRGTLHIMGNMMVTLEHATMCQTRDRDLLLSFIVHISNLMAASSASIPCYDKNFAWFGPLKSRETPKLPKSEIHRQNLVIQGSNHLQMGSNLPHSRCMTSTTRWCHQNMPLCTKQEIAISCYPW